MAGPWPDQAKTDFSSAAARLSDAKTPQEIADATAAMRDVALAYPDADGSALLAKVLDSAQSGNRAHAGIVEGLATLAKSNVMDAETLASVVAPIMLGIAEMHKQGTLAPSVAIALNDAKKKLDAVLAKVDLPSFDELISDHLGGGEKASAALKQWSNIAAAARLALAAKNLKNADRATDDEFIKGYFGVMPHPIFQSPVVDALTEKLAWDREMFRESTNAIDLVASAIEGGEFDHDAYNKIENRLEKLSKGPWGTHTGKAFVTKVCGEIPVIKPWCNDLFDLITDVVEELSSDCRKIDCDCENVVCTRGGLGGILQCVADEIKNNCEIKETSLLNDCKLFKKVVGSCNPAGPDAYPARGSGFSPVR